MKIIATAAAAVLLAIAAPATAHAEDGPVNSPTFTDSPVQIVFCLAPGACRL